MVYLNCCKKTGILILVMLAVAVFSGHSFAAEDDDANPLSLWKGEGKSYLKATFSSEMAYFAQDNSWFGEAKANLGEDSDDWWEGTMRPGIEGSYDFLTGGEVYSRFDAVYATTQDTDAGGSNNGQGNNSKMRVEDAYLGWRSGSLFSSLDNDFLDISFGRQKYQVDTGFLFYNQSGNGDRRGAFWIGDRHNAQYMGLVRLKTGGWDGDAVYFKADDAPDTDTKVGGARLDYNFSRGSGKDEDRYAGVGGGFYYIDSNTDSRDDMSVYNVRADIKPFDAFNVLPALKPFTLKAEFVYEDLDDDSTGDSGVGWYVQPSYEFDIAWKPQLTYRYASFDKDFDPLFYGFQDWGNWYQGEILGEYVLINQNLNSHMVKLDVKPTDSLTINLFYYNFTIDNEDAFGVDDDSYADEVNLIADYTFNDHLSFSVVGAYANPDDAAEQQTGGDDDWWYAMIYTKISF